MPIDWDEFESDLNDTIDNAADRTDTKLASRISSITRMTDEEIEELFPKPADVKKLVKLMKIVKSAEDRNSKINKIISNVEELAGTVLTVLEKF
ncbi:MAG TPA: hypothetical protein ENI76_03170, partial [Ignavibacteria bacterium]|nr:hypothetical protein [Ignavibacteria bacterium]